MKSCLHCKKEFEEKRESAKFCSTSCRVMYNRKHGKKRGMSEIQVQVLYNEIMSLVGQMKSGTPQKQYSVAPPELNIEPTKTYSMNVPPQIVMRNYWLEKTELSADTYPEWLKRLYADPRLNSKQKDLIKNTNQHE